MCVWCMRVRWCTDAKVGGKLVYKSRWMRAANDNYLTNMKEARTREKKRKWWVNRLGLSELTETSDGAVEVKWEQSKDIVSEYNLDDVRRDQEKRHQGTFRLQLSPCDSLSVCSKSLRRCSLIHAVLSCPACRTWRLSLHRPPSQMLLILLLSHLLCLQSMSCCCFLDVSFARFAVC